MSRPLHGKGRLETRSTHRNPWKRRKGDISLAALLLLLVATGSLRAGGAWVLKPREVTLQVGYDWKSQPDAKRRGTDGDIYRSLYNLTHDFRFLYASTSIGVIKGLECNLLVTYLWAREEVDSTSEDPTRIYDGFSDMWLGARYQLVDGDWPCAVGVSVRLPWLYEGSSTLNGQVLLEAPGLLNRDYEITGYLSHSFTDRIYGSTSLGFRLREGAPAHQITFNIEGGVRLPIFGDILSLRGGIDGAASVGEPGRYSSARDRFSGLSTEVGTHQFDFNNATFIQPKGALSVAMTDRLEGTLGYSCIAWGLSTVVYRDMYIQLGYAF